MDKINNIEKNVILYYADFLSLKNLNKSVTDNCKYYFIFGVPVNSLYILDMDPVYDENNLYYQLSLFEYRLIKDKFGEEGVNDFVSEICNIKSCGAVDGLQMLKYIHRYSTRHDRSAALSSYKRWKNKLKYTHFVKNDDGDLEEKECSKYVYHAEKMLEKQRIKKR